MAATMLSFEASGGSLETMYPPRMLLMASSPSSCSGGAMVAWPAKKNGGRWTANRLSANRHPMPRPLGPLDHEIIPSQHKQSVPFGHTCTQRGSCSHNHHVPKARGVLVREGICRRHQARQNDAHQGRCRCWWPCWRRLSGIGSTDQGRPRCGGECPLSLPASCRRQHY